MSFPTLALCFLLPLRFSSLLSEFDPNGRWTQVVTALVGWCIGVTVVEALNVGLAGAHIQRKRRRLLRRINHILVLFGSAAVALGGLHAHLLVQVFLPSLILLAASNTLYAAYLRFGRSFPPDSAIYLATQTSRLWLPLGILTVLLHYLLVQVRLADSGQPRQVLVTLAVVALGLAGEFAISFFYTIRIRRGWEEGEWYRDLTRGMLYAGMSWLLYCHFSTTHPSELLAKSAFFSVALGLILKPSLGNFVAGLTLRMAPPYALGDFVQIGNHIGMVYAIDWRSTAIKLYNGDLRIFPSSYVSRHVLRNISQPTKDHANYVDLKVSPHVPPHVVRHLIFECIEQIPEILADPAAEVYLSQIGGKNGMCEYRIRYWINSFFNNFTSESALQSQILYRFNREGISISVPTLMVYEPERRKAW